MATINNFEDLKVWCDSRNISKRVYSITRKSNLARDFALKDQIRRSCISIMSNIAEGFERGGNKEFIQFLFIAKGSAGEARSQLYMALDLGYISKRSFEEMASELSAVSKQISGLIQYLKSSTMKGAKR